MNKLILATTLMLSSLFAFQGAFASENSMRETCRAEAADAGIEDKDEMDNYIAECLDMMRETQSDDSNNEDQDSEGQEEGELRSSRH